MIRLLKIELGKIFPYKPFWVLMGLYTFLLGLVISILENFAKANTTVNGQQVDLSEFNIYEFPFIWRMVAYTGSWWLVIPGIVIIMLVTNEISFRTLRQNIINGLSRAEVLTGHLLLILLISLYCLFLLFAVGFAMGFTHSTAQGADAIFGNMAYMGASFLQTFSYLLAALLVGLFFQRAGISIGLLILYTFIVGPIIAYLTGDLLDLFVPMRPNNKSV